MLVPSYRINVGFGWEAPFDPPYSLIQLVDKRLPGGYHLAVGTRCALAISILAVWMALACAPAMAEPFKLADVPVVTTLPKVDGTLGDPAWQHAAKATLAWDFNHNRAASQPTEVYVLASAADLYVAFVAHQTETLTATQRTNDVPMPGDDVVRVYFWPAGTGGFEYGFISNPAGTRYEFSGENNNFAPHWTSVATRTADGYIVTMRIPLNAMRASAGTWLVQFDRRVHETNELFEWAHGASQNATDDVRFAGEVRSPASVTGAARTKPRIAVYALGQAGAASAGGSTSRTGVDLALPVTPTASLVATFHPDFSNVELDQQTISPTAFARQFQEVRPFFTQGGNEFNSFDCNSCFVNISLYTPGIPTPSRGYALEGRQDLLRFSMLDAVNAGRQDVAGVLGYSNAAHTIGEEYQRVSLYEPGFVDDVNNFQIRGNNGKNGFWYGTYGMDSGTNVTDPGQGLWREFGVGTSSNVESTGVFAAVRDIGSQYDPADGLNQHPGVAGYAVFGEKEWRGGPDSPVQSTIFTYNVDRYHGAPFGGLNQADTGPSLTVTTKTQFTYSAFVGDSYLVLNDGNSYDFNQNGGSVAYGENTNSPSSIAYFKGRFAAGSLTSLFQSAATRIDRLGVLSLEGDVTHFTPDAGGGVDTQWLERASYTYQFNPDESFSIGARRIIGIAPPIDASPSFVDARNVTAAYYKRFGHYELYAVYGDPSQLSTRPAFVLKLVTYIGAEKGT
ncbi:MAG TPA: DUF5916 domain-containing protein [Candidatus Eremiobacteraceae bacterium]